MRKWSKLLATMRFIFPALKKKGGRVSGLGDVPPPACSASLPLSPRFCSSCKLLVAVTLLSGPETSSGLHLFIWAAQILGFYCPACGSHTVEAGHHMQCQAQQLWTIFQCCAINICPPPSGLVLSTVIWGLLKDLICLEKSSVTKVLPHSRGQGWPRVLQVLLQVFAWL